MNVYDFDGTIFYSDSLADTPLALCAEKAHLVTNKATTVTDWPDLDAETVKKVKEKIDTGWNIHLKEAGIDFYVGASGEELTKEDLDWLSENGMGVIDSDIISFTNMYEPQTGKEASFTATFPGAETITVYRDGEKTEIAGETLELTLASRGGAFVTVE